MKSSDPASCASTYLAPSTSFRFSRPLSNNSSSDICCPFLCPLASEPNMGLVQTGSFSFKCPLWVESGQSEGAPNRVASYFEPSSVGMAVGVAIHQLCPSGSRTATPSDRNPDRLARSELLHRRVGPGGITSELDE